MRGFLARKRVRLLRVQAKARAALRVRKEKSAAERITWWYRGVLAHAHFAGRARERRVAAIARILAPGATRRAQEALAEAGARARLRAAVATRRAQEALAAREGAIGVALRERQERLRTRARAALVVQRAWRRQPLPAAADLRRASRLWKFAPVGPRVETPPREGLAAVPESVAAVPENVAPVVALPREERSSIASSSSLASSSVVSGSAASSTAASASVPPVPAVAPPAVEETPVPAVPQTVPPETPAVTPPAVEETPVPAVPQAVPPVAPVRAETPVVAAVRQLEAEGVRWKDTVRPSTELVRPETPEARAETPAAAPAAAEDPVVATTIPRAPAEASSRPDTALTPVHTSVVSSRPSSPGATALLSTIVQGHARQVDAAMRLQRFLRRARSLPGELPTVDPEPAAAAPEAATLPREPTPSRAPTPPRARSKAPSEREAPRARSKRPESERERRLEERLRRSKSASLAPASRGRKPRESPGGSREKGISRAEKQAALLRMRSPEVEAAASAGPARLDGSGSSFGKVRVARKPKLPEERKKRSPDQPEPPPPEAAFPPGPGSPMSTQELLGNSQRTFFSTLPGGDRAETFLRSLGGPGSSDAGLRATLDGLQASGDLRATWRATFSDDLLPPEASASLNQSFYETFATPLRRTGQSLPLGSGSMALQPSFYGAFAPAPESLPQPQEDVDQAEVALDAWAAFLQQSDAEQAGPPLLTAAEHLARTGDVALPEGAEALTQEAAEQAEPAAAEHRGRADENSDEKPASREAKKPDEKPTDRSAKKPDEKPTDQGAKKPDEKPASREAKKPDERPASREEKKPDEKPGSRDAKKPDEKPTDRDAKKPDEKPPARKSRPEPLETPKKETKPEPLETPKKESKPEPLETPVKEPRKAEPREKPEQVEAASRRKPSPRRKPAAGVFSVLRHADSALQGAPGSPVRHLQAPTPRAEDPKPKAGKAEPPACPPPPFAPTPRGPEPKAGKAGIESRDVKAAFAPGAWGRGMPVNMAPDLEAALRAEMAEERARRAQELEDRAKAREARDRQKRAAEAAQNRRLLESMAAHKEVSAVQSADAVERWKQQKAREGRAAAMRADAEVARLKAKQEAQKAKMDALAAEVTEDRRRRGAQRRGELATLAAAERELRLAEEATARRAAAERELEAMQWMAEEEEVERGGTPASEASTVPREQSYGHPTMLPRLPPPAVLAGRGKPRPPAGAARFAQASAAYRLDRRAR